MAYPEPAIEPPPGCKLGRDVPAVQRPEVRRFVRDVLDEIMALNMPVILCPNSHFYFDYPQEPQSAAPGEHVITTETVRSFRISAAPHVLGVQANLWTEHIRTPEQLFHLAFPRAEVPAEKFIPQSAAAVTGSPGE